MGLMIFRQFLPPTAVRRGYRLNIFELSEFEMKRTMKDIEIIDIEILKTYSFVRLFIVSSL